MTHTTFRTGLTIIAALAIGCSKSDFPTTPGPTAQTPLTTVAAMKVSGTASLGAGGLTPISMTLIARSLDSTAIRTTQALTPGTTELSGNFELGNGVKGTVSGSVEGSLENGTLRGTLSTGAGGCNREYTGPVSSAGVAWQASDSSGDCPLPVTIQASRADTPSACTFAVSTPGAVPGTGSTIVISITTGPTCGWVVGALDPWVRVTGASTGIGSGSVTLVVDPTASPRQGTIVVAGQSLTITQTQTCTVSVAPSANSFPEEGGSRTLTVTAPSGCGWSAENVPEWVTLSPASGSGTTTITLIAQPNTGALREASFRIGGQTVNLTQAARAGGPPPCIQGVALSGASFPATGGTGVIEITASADCAWTAASDVPWLVLSADSGNGPGQVSFKVQPNEGAQRSGTIRVGGRVLTVTQAAPSAPVCNYQLTGSPTSFPANGGTGNVTIATGATCTWLVQSTVDWITVTTPTGQGNGGTSFTVAANPTGALRQGELRVGTQTLAIAQQGLSASVRVTLFSLRAQDNCSDDDDDESCPYNYGGGMVTAPGFSCSIAEVRGTEGSTTTQTECVGIFPVGSPVTLTATPAVNSDFAGWGGACDGTAPTCTINVTAGGHSVSASFRPEPVLVVLPGSTRARITSQPPGIDCRVPASSSSCRLQTDTDTEVVLTSSEPNVFWLGCDTPPRGTPSSTCRVRMTGNRTVRIVADQFSGGEFEEDTRNLSTGSLLRRAKGGAKKD